MIDDSPAVSAYAGREAAGPSRRPRGRPLEMSAQAVLATIRSLADQQRLVRVHRDRPALYARARRMYGSWAGALREAGLDPESVVAEARQRARAGRRSPA